MNGFLLVGAGGALGAMARYGTGLVLGRIALGGFPFATLSVNILGSFLMGVLVGALAKLLPAGQNEIRLFLAVGMLGGFTTFSAFSLDAITLIERGAPGQAVIYMAVSVGAGVLAVIGGLMLMRGLPL